MRALHVCELAQQTWVCVPMRLGGASTDNSHVVMVMVMGVTPEESQVFISVTSNPRKPLSEEAVGFLSKTLFSENGLSRKSVGKESLAVGLLIGFDKYEKMPYAWRERLEGAAGGKPRSRASVILIFSGRTCTGFHVANLSSPFIDQVAFSYEAVSYPGSK